jgi:hypothetical protein
VVGWVQAQVLVDKALVQGLALVGRVVVQVRVQELVDNKVLVPDLAADKVYPYQDHTKDAAVVAVVHKVDVVPDNNNGKFQVHTRR